MKTTVNELIEQLRTMNQQARVEIFSPCDSSDAMAITQIGDDLVMFSPASFLPSPANPKDVDKFLVDKIAQHLHINENQLKVQRGKKGRKGAAPDTEARMIYCSFMYELCGNPAPATIAMYLNHERSSVYYYINTAFDLFRLNSDFRDKYLAICREACRFFGKEVKQPSGYLNRKKVLENGKFKKVTK